MRGKKSSMLFLDLLFIFWEANVTITTWKRRQTGIKGHILWKFIFRLLPVLLESGWIKLSAESHDQLSSGVAEISVFNVFSLFRLFAAAVSLKREQNNHSPVFSPLSHQGTGSCPRSLHQSHSLSPTQSSDPVWDPESHGDIELRKIAPSCTSKVRSTQYLLKNCNVTKNRMSKRVHIFYKRIFICKIIHMMHHMPNISMVHWAHKLTFSLPLQTLKFIIPPRNLFLMPIADICSAASAAHHT